MIPKPPRVSLLSSIIFLLFTTPILCNIFELVNLTTQSTGISIRQSNDLSAYHVPLSNGSSSLPAPTSQLKAVALGRGTQNYTTNNCTLLGARATLFSLDKFLSPDSMSTIYALPSDALNFPLSFIREMAKDTDVEVLGHHLFNSKGVPCFNLSRSGLGNLQGVKKGDVVAPSSSSSSSGKPGVDWLMLDRKQSQPQPQSKRNQHENESGNGGGGGDGQGQKNTSDSGNGGGGGQNTKLQQVYRVYTAGGKPPAGGCAAPASTTTATPGTGISAKEDGEIEVEYAALYWFYGD